MLPIWSMILFAGTAASMAQSALPIPAEEQTSIEETSIVDYGHDQGLRMTVPVHVAGQGPYHFVVDTGAERTAISRELAEKLTLKPGPKATLHSLTETSQISTVIIPSIEISDKRVSGITAPTLSRSHMGAEGLLGVDTLASQRVEFDFAKREMHITPSHTVEPKWEPGTITVTGRRRYGRLVLVDAEAEGERIHVIIDTGGQVTVGNMALFRRLRAKSQVRMVAPVEVISVTGGTITADYMTVDRIRIGGIDITNMPIAFANVAPFKKLKLTGRPAILLGMDALKLFDRVSIDFAKRKVKMLPPDESGLREELHYAAR